MIRHVILDTGPLVAVLNRGDRHHQWARDQWAQIAPPLFTCEAVLAETCFLVRRFPGGQATVMDLVQRGILDLSFHLLEETHAVSRLLKKYQDVPMSFADACLVRMAGTVCGRSYLHTGQRFFNLPQERSPNDSNLDASHRALLNSGIPVGLERIRAFAGPSLPQPCKPNRSSPTARARGSLRRSSGTGGRSSAWKQAPSTTALSRRSCSG